MSKQTQETYDQVASTYAQQNSHTYASLLEEAAAFTATLQAGSLIADIGCGPGRDTLMLRQLGMAVIGLDLSLGQLRAGHLTGVLQADMRHLPLRTGSLDAIWCHAALMHILREDLPGVLNEFSRVSTVGSLLHLVVAEGDGQGWEPALAYGSQSPRWFTYYRDTELIRQLSATVFRVRRIRHQQAGRKWLSIQAEHVTP